MENEKVESDRTKENTTAYTRHAFNTHVRDSEVILKDNENSGRSRRDFLVKTGRVLSAVIGGAIFPGALSANPGESDGKADPPEIPSTDESTDSETQKEPTERDPFWYARDIMGLID